MISDKDRRLLERRGPELERHVDVDGTTLLAELRRREVITGQQEEAIKVRHSLFTMC